jgi:hypothetical protein
MHDTVQGIVAAAVVIDGAGMADNGADQRPAFDFGLGHERHPAQAVQYADVNPADVVGHEQHRARQRRAEAAYAQTEDAHQDARPESGCPLINAFAIDAEAAEHRAEQQQHDRQADQGMHQQQRNAVEVAEQSGHGV